LRRGHGRGGGVDCVRVGMNAARVSPGRTKAGVEGTAGQGSGRSVDVA
jgi:hypothetical protein